MSAPPTMPIRFEDLRFSNRAVADADRAESFDAELAAAARCACYSLLSTALHYPGDELVGLLINERSWETMMAKTSALGSLCARLEGIRKTALKTEKGKKPTRAELLDGLESAFSRLFGHTVQGTVPLYELAYGNREIVQQAPELADIVGFYSAFGLQIAEGVHERPDHAALECEFMALLTAKETVAIEQDPEFVELVHDAECSFVAQHLGWWLPALAAKLNEADPGGFYGTVASCIVDFMALEAGRLQVELGPKYLAVRPLDPSVDAAISCEPDAACSGSEPRQEFVQLAVNGRARP